MSVSIIMFLSFFDTFPLFPELDVS